MPPLVSGSRIWSAFDASAETLLVRHVVAKTGPGRVATEAAENAEGPTQLVALALKEYVVALVRPLTVQDVAGTVMVHSLPASSTATTL